MFLEIQNIQKSFGQGDNQVAVLKGIDISVEKGDFCVLLGPSGSGKSTLMNIIGDIDQAYIGTVLDENAVTKISRQLMRSMGDMMGLINLFAVGMFMVLVYLLSKMIIEKNALSISMAKILGYSRGEIFRLYVLPTTIVTLSMILLSLPVETKIMDVVFRAVMTTSMTGWIPIYYAPDLYIKMAAYGFVTYGIVALLELRRIEKIPESEALKCVE